MVLVGGRSMVLAKVWLRRGRVHEGVRVSKGRGRDTSMISLGGSSAECWWWRRLLEKRNWVRGEYAAAESEGSKSRKRRERCIFQLWLWLLENSKSGEGMKIEW